MVGLWKTPLRFRFSLKQLMLLMAVLGVCLGAWVARARCQEATVKAIVRAGGTVAYSYQEKSYLAAPSGFKAWIAATLGPDYAYRLLAVAFCPDSDHPADELIRVLESASPFKRLAI